MNTPADNGTPKRKEGDAMSATQTSEERQRDKELEELVRAWERFAKNLSGLGFSRDGLKLAAIQAIGATR